MPVGCNAVIGGAVTDLASEELWADGYGEKDGYGFARFGGWTIAPLLYGRDTGVFPGNAACRSGFGCARSGEVSDSAGVVYDGIEDEDA